jgi:hypothetical protein
MIYINTGNLWIFLFFTGYLKKSLTGVQQILDLSTPNMELQYIYETQVQNWFEEHIKERDFHVLFKAVLEGNAEIKDRRLMAVVLYPIHLATSQANM